MRDETIELEAGIVRSLMEAAEIDRTFTVTVEKPETTLAYVAEVEQTLSLEVEM